MTIRQLISVVLVALLTYTAGWARTYTVATFRETCDLIQDMGQTNLPLAYEWLAEYVPKVKKTGNRRWTHILLIN